MSVTGQDKPPLLPCAARAETQVLPRSGDGKSLSVTGQDKPPSCVSQGRKRSAEGEYLRLEACVSLFLNCLWVI